MQHMPLQSPAAWLEKSRRISSWLMMPGGNAQPCQQAMSSVPMGEASGQQQAMVLPLDAASGQQHARPAVGPPPALNPRYKY